MDPRLATIVVGLSGAALLLLVAGRISERQLQGCLTFGAFLFFLGAVVAMIDGAVALVFGSSWLR